MLGVLRDFERALCMAHAGAEIATFDKRNRQPSTIQDRGYDAQVITVGAELIGVEFKALLEQQDRGPIFAEGVITLREAEERLTSARPVAAFARKPNPGLTKLDGTALFADQEMVIALERGVLGAALLVAKGVRTGSSSSKRTRIRSVSKLGSRAFRSSKRRSTACSRLSRVSGNFFRTVNARSKKRAASAFA